MSWLIFAVGVVVGTVMGVFVLALCQMAPSSGPNRIINREPEFRHESLRARMLAKHADSAH